MKPIRKRSAEELTTESIRAEIVSGRLASGTRLTELALASKLEVSRATVRAALHQLVREGLVVQVPYTGSVVASLTARDAWELYTLRASLESLGARLAAERLDDAGRAKLSSAYERLCKAALAGKLMLCAEADFAFHQQIVTLAGHRRLLEQYRIVEQQVRLSIFSTNALLPDLRSVIEQHDPIKWAIMNGCADDAARFAELHNLSEGRKLEEHLGLAESSARGFDVPPATEASRITSWSRR